MWLGVAFAALFLQAGASPVTDWQAEGLKALNQRDYPAAITAFQKAVEADARDYAAHFHLALAYSLTNKDEAGIAEYRKTLELKPELYEANLNLGILLLRNRQPEPAIASLERAVAAKPKEARPLLYLADALLAVNRFNEARQGYETVLTLGGNEAAAQLGLGRVEARQGNLDAAAPHFSRAAELDPSLQESLLELADLYEAGKRYPEAVAIYAKFPDNAAARERAGQILLSTGKPAEAIPNLEFAVQASPTSGNRLALATAYFANKDVEKGAKILNEALTADPKNYDLRMLAGRILRDHKRYSDATNQFMQALAIKPESVESWRELVTVSTLSENYPQALAALDKLKSLGAETTSHFYLRAIMLDKLQQYQPALENYQRFLAAAAGKFPDEEFKSRQRVRIIQKELSKR